MKFFSTLIVLMSLAAPAACAAIRGDKEKVRFWSFGRIFIQLNPNSFFHLTYFVCRVVVCMIDPHRESVFANGNEHIQQSITDSNLLCTVTGSCVTYRAV